jgi:mono/diheme cytochrome c family protein
MRRLGFRLGRVVLVFAAAMVLRPGFAGAAGDAESGHRLARLWCASCHVVDGASTGKDVAPPLAEIAKRGAPGQLHARAFLAAPHPPMPNLNLARAQIDDIVAYLDSLAARP